MHRRTLLAAAGPLAIAALPATPSAADAPGVTATEIKIGRPSV